MIATDPASEILYNLNVPTTMDKIRKIVKGSSRCLILYIPIFQEGV
jgi:hypothetical protein